MSRHAWPLVPLGSVVNHRKEFICIDDLTRYKRCRVQLHAKGVVLRDEVEGALIKTKTQQICRANEFLVAEIDAKVGGFGIVPVELDGAVVSSHYFLFTPHTDKLLPEFLAYYSRTPAFREQVTSRGSTNYAAIRPSHVLGYSIPLPPINEQRRIVHRVAYFEAMLANITHLRREANERRDRLIGSLTSAICDSLDGVPYVAIGQLGQGGCNPVQTGPFGAQLHSSEFTEEGVPVLNVGNVWPEGLRLEYVDHVSPEKASQLSRYAIKADDLLFARSGATLGKVCVVPQNCDGWLMTGHLFRVRFNQDLCLPAFAFAILRGSRNARDQIRGQVRGATRPGFNTTLLSRVEIPLPPLEQQRLIIARLEQLSASLDQVQDLQKRTSAEFDALLPSILERAFRGEL
jgi:type I restriction enzyme S subunit